MFYTENNTKHVIYEAYVIRRKKKTKSRKNISKNLLSFEIPSVTFCSSYGINAKSVNLFLSNLSIRWVLGKEIKKKRKKKIINLKFTWFHDDKWKKIILIKTFIMITFYNTNSIILLLIINRYSQNVQKLVSHYRISISFFFIP